MKKITLLAAATTFALSSICVQADTLLAPSAYAKMDGENKIVRFMVTLSLSITIILIPACGI